MATIPFFYDGYEKTLISSLRNLSDRNRPHL